MEEKEEQERGLVHRHETAGESTQEGDRRQGGHASEDIGQGSDTGRRTAQLPGDVKIRPDWDKGSTQPESPGELCAQCQEGPRLRGPHMRNLRGPIRES